MIKIISSKHIGYCYELTIVLNGDTIKAKTYFDYDGHDKVDIDGKTYELVGLSYLREV
jgi:hypothetical protein